MMRRWIYDTSSLVGYALDTSRRVAVGLRLIADDPEFRLTVPGICLIEAYLAVPEPRRWRLDALAANPGVQVVGVPAETALEIGRAGVVTGRPGAGQAAYLARLGPSIVFTDASMPKDVDVRPI